MRTVEIEDGVQMVDLQRIYFKGEAGSFAGECRGGASEKCKRGGIHPARTIRRAVAFMISGMKPGTGRRGVVHESIGPRRPAFFKRGRNAWLRIWRGCWVVSWEDGRTRVFWKAGEV